MSYVGSGKSIYKRIAHHFSTLRSNRHSNKHLQNSFNKYGEDAFEVMILEVCTLNNLKEREEYHILNTSSRYNFIDKPTGPLQLPRLDAERRKIVSEKLTGRKRTIEQKNVLVNHI
jgi:group I intron endonuclease